MQGNGVTVAAGERTRVRRTAAIIHAVGGECAGMRRPAAKLAAMMPSAEMLVAMTTAMMPRAKMLVAVTATMVTAAMVPAATAAAVTTLRVRISGRRQRGRQNNDGNSQSKLRHGTPHLVTPPTGREV